MNRNVYIKTADVKSFIDGNEESIGKIFTTDFEEYAFEGSRYLYADEVRQVASLLTRLNRTEGLRNE